IPAQGRAVLRPLADELDFSLFELDPRAEPRTSRSSNAAMSTETAHSPLAFMPRMATNENDFVHAGGWLRVWRNNLVPAVSSDRGTLPFAHVRRPAGISTQPRDGRL